MITNAQQAVRYRDQARKLRVLASDLPPHFQADLTKVADEYIRMAERAESRPPHEAYGLGDGAHALSRQSR